MKDPTEILLDLVAIPSVSPMSNQPVIDYVTKLLNPADWSIYHYPYLDSEGTSKNNLVAFTKNAAASHAELTFVCHTDTVPFDPAWFEAVHPKIIDGRLYGRGSCDVKGFLACALAALTATDLSALAKSLALVLTADEEVGCRGAKHLAALKVFSTRYMIIGEPTRLRAVRAGKGYALATITVHGAEAHSAFPSKGRSAIYDAARVLLGLEALAAELAHDTRDDRFDPPFTTLNVGLIQGGTAKNIVPGECQITVEWRPVPSQRPNFVADRITQLLNELASASPSLDATLNVLRTDPAFAPSESTRIADLLSALSGNETTTIAFGSEAAHLAGLSSETVVFGAGDITVAHKTGEHIAISELRLCAENTYSVIEEVCRA
jgi:acetylornithine deacetylase